MAMMNSALGDSLVANGEMSEEECNRALQECQNADVPFVQYIVDNKIIESSKLLEFCEKEWGIPSLDLDEFDLTGIDKKFTNPELILKYHAIPVMTQGRSLYVAISDPTATQALEDFGFTYGYTSEPLLVDELKLQKAIKTLTKSDDEVLAEELSGDELMEALNEEATPVEDEAADEAALAGGDTKDDTPVVAFINKMLRQAIQMGASDLHFEPYEKKYRVRFRIDGILRVIAQPPKSLSERFSARMKVMAKLDIAERRLPQDGRIKFKVDAKKTIDLRVNSLPTLWGEKIVMRILDSSPAKLDIDKLGFNDIQKKEYLDALHRSQGLILVTGPTGSGKTVSLYTGLGLLNDDETNISTAEDPVEINLYGINQVQMNPKAGLTFAAALRAFLRQDPDVIMVGEIRDLETAEIAIKAAQTGHLVLSTLHTNSAPETLTRLLNMGVPAFNIASSVTLIMAQRLARRLCEKCKILDNVPEHELLKIGYTQEDIDKGLKIYKPNPQGCEACSGGYKGRVGIYEIFVMSDKLAMLIMEVGNSLQIAAEAEKEGMVPLRKSRLMKVAQGVTSLQEVFRVTSG